MSGIQSHSSATGLHSRDRPGPAAIEALKHGSFDLVLADIHMGGMSGTQFLRAVRERDLRLPVILMTGHPEVETAVEAVDYGASRYLTKPISKATMAQAVRGAIHSHVMAELLAERISLVPACRRIIRATCQGAEWDFAAIWVTNGEPFLGCAGTWVRPGCDLSAFEKETDKLHPQRGEGLSGRVWASATPEWIPELSTDANFPHGPITTAVGLRSGFAVPIGAAGQVFAVVEFFSRNYRAPDLALLDLFAMTTAELGARVLQQRADQRTTQAEAAQRTISSTLDAIMECAPAFILAIDLTGKIQFINRVMEHHKKEEVVGSDWLDYMPQPNRAAHGAQLREMLRTGVASTLETTLIGPNGGNLWFTTHLGPLRDKAEIVGAVIVGQEVTTLKQSQAEAAAAQRLATVGTLAAGIAHEVNTPVQFVSDSVQFLRDATQEIFALLSKLQDVRRLATEIATDPVLKQTIEDTLRMEDESDLAYLQENVPKAFERCADGIDRIATIVRSMKEFTHPGQQEMTAVDLNRALRSTLTVARSEYKYVAELEVDLGEIPLVTCQVNDINQVVLNLVVNAAQAIGDVVTGTENRGTIRVKTQQDGAYVLISIADTGGGISPEVAHRIFEPFFTTKEVGKGTGQGLAIARSLIKDKHGGDLTFESAVGVGTTFVVRLPIEGSTDRQPAAEVAASA